MYCITYAKLCKLYGYCRGAWQGCIIVLFCVFVVFFSVCRSMYSTSTICTVQNNVYVNMSVYFVCILVERGTSGGRVAGHVTASGPLGTCLYVQGVQNSGYSGLRKVQPKVFQ